MIVLSAAAANSCHVIVLGPRMVDHMVAIDDQRSMQAHTCGCCFSWYSVESYFIELGH